MEKQSRKHTSPIEIGDTFLEQLNDIASQVGAMIKAAMARHEGLTVVQLDAFVAGQPTPGVDEWKRNHLSSEIGDATRADYTLKLLDGSSIETSDLSEITEALRTRPSGAERLIFGIGKYRDLRVDASFGGYVPSSAQSEIKGDRPDVQYADGLISDLIANAEPSFQLLYRPKFGVAVTIGFTFILWLFYLFAAAYSAVKFGRSISDWTLPLGAPICVAVGVFWSIRYDKMFPLVQFTFGRAGRRRASKRTLLFQSLGVICIPVVLAVGQAWLFPGS